MNEVLKAMLKKYSLQNKKDYENALKEIIQEIALLGLWRAKFFEKAVFYGGSALRVLYNSGRFSEDLDFSLIKKDLGFNLVKYFKGIVQELESYGFKPRIEELKKSSSTKIESAFIKAGTRQQFILIEAPEDISRKIQLSETLKVKFEIDIDPPKDFSTDTKMLLLPIPFYVVTMDQPSLFAGKINAILTRNWKKWVKGRDFYDMVWLAARDIPVNVKHLKARLVQNKVINTNESFDSGKMKEVLKEKISSIDIEAAKSDISPFIKDIGSLSLWSKKFFFDIIDKIKVV